MKDKLLLANAIAMALIGIGQAAEPSQSFAETTDDRGDGVEVVARSPQGSFRIEHRWRRQPNGAPGTDYNSFVVPEKPENGEAILLESEIEPVRHYRISPDEKWIYAEFKCYTRRSSCELFERNRGLHFAKVFTKPAEDGGNFDDAMWEFFSQTTGLRHAEYPRLCDVVAWAPDSSRLLVALRGVAVPKNWKAKRPVENNWSPGVYGWLVYWNTITRAFELTAMLKQKNDGAAKRWADDSRGADLSEPFCAEPVGQLPPIEELDQKLESVRAKMEQAWTQMALAKQRDAEDRAWPEIEKRAAAWKRVRMADAENGAIKFAQRWPKAKREQWQRLSLLGRLDAIVDEVEHGWPWVNQ